MPGFFDTAKPGQPLTNSVLPVLPSANWTTSALRTSGFSLLISPARTRPCERFTCRLAATGASLGVEVIGYSFLPAGLSPAVLPKLACRTQLAWLFPHLLSSTLFMLICGLEGTPSQSVRECMHYTLKTCRILASRQP